MIWSFGAFELDLTHYELRKHGQPVELRRKVFDVLRYLVTHSDRLVSKEELLQNVWPGETIHEGVVPQNIAILRRVLGDSRESARIIQTVHGRGYRFVADVTTSAQPAPERAEPRMAAVERPFVGREHVMQELRAALAEAASGSGRLVLVTGEPGIGKTRVAEELAAEARDLGARVLEGRCHEGEGAPAYWPWMQILREAAQGGEVALEPSQVGLGGADVAHLVSELRGQFGELPRTAPLDSKEARFRLFDGITSFLAGLSRAQPLLVIFDDLHWADEATLHLLRFFAREVRALPLLVLATSRDVDAHAEPATSALITALAGGAHVQRVYLRGLSHAATCELVNATLRRELSEPLLRELHGLTEGNPFFVNEVARLLADEAHGAGSEGRWRLELPRRVREVIGLRLLGLGAEAQRVLAVAAVIGRDFNLAVLAQVTGMPHAELLTLLRAASAARVVGEAEAPSADEHGAPAAFGHYRFAHALIRESLYGALPEAERVRLHEQVGRALEALYGVESSAHLTELAHHFYRAASGGDVERAVAYCVRAAEQAADLLAFEQAVMHYRRALEALASRLPIDEQRRFSLKLALGSAQFRAGEDGNTALLGAAEIARRLSRPDLIGEVVLAMCGWPRFGRRGRTSNPELYPLLAEALAAPLDATPGLRARLLSVLALNSKEDTPFSEQVAQSQRALELARAARNDEALYDALSARILLIQAPEDTEQRLELATELLAVAHRLGRRERIFTAHEMRVQPLLALGNLAAADREIEICCALAEELRLRKFTLQALRMRLERALGDGRWDEIRPLTREAVRVRGQAAVSPGYLVTLFVWRTYARAFQGDQDWFDRHIDDMAGAIAASALMRSHVAFLYAQFGRHAEARACYASLLDPQLLDGTREDNWLMTFTHVAEAAAACGDLAAARELYPRLLPHAARNVVHVEWLIYFGSCAHWLAGLAALLGKRADAIAHFEAALESDARIGARPALARTSLAYAKLLLGEGAQAEPASTPAEVERGQTLLREALALAEQLGMQRLLREAQALAAV